MRKQCPGHCMQDSKSLSNPFISHRNLCTDYNTSHEGSETARNNVMLVLMRHFSFYNLLSTSCKYTMLWICPYSSKCPWMEGVKRRMYRITCASKESKLLCLHGNHKFSLSATLFGASIHSLVKKMIATLIISEICLHQKLWWLLFLYVIIAYRLSSVQCNSTNY